MAKLGMPSVNIAFTEAGIEAIERSQRGIVALILEEPSSTIEALAAGGKDVEGNELPVVNNPFVVYTTDDIPEKLTDENKDYIRKTLLGYTKTPYRIRVYMQPTVTATEGEADPNKDADKFAGTLKVMATDRWDYLAIPTITDAQTEAVATWLKSNRENKGKRSKAVLPNYSGDYEGIINFTNTKIVTADKTYTAAQYTPRIAGLIAGTPMTIAATYAPLPEVIDCDKYTQDENDEKVNKGEFFVWFDGEKYKMSRGVNSLVTTTQGKLEAYQTIKSVDCMDMIYDDIKRTAEDSYIGKYTNDYDNKKLLISAIYGYFRELESARLLQKGYSNVDINADAVKNYQLKHGLYTKEELAAMSDDEIKQLDTKKQVYLSAKIKILDAMEDITLDVAI